MSEKRELLNWNVIPKKLQEEIKAALAQEHLDYRFELHGKYYILHDIESHDAGVIVEPVEVH